MALVGYPQQLLASIGYVPPSEMEAEYERWIRGAEHDRQELRIKEDV